ncbi:hypothetical protein HGA34_02385 [Candidatus Falkowbacteria bacterium]|nr:hypothetical protein [Candidatus Falkowbacteria bacterium]
MSRTVRSSSDVEAENRLIAKFTETLKSYRGMVCQNYNSRMGDEDDKRPLERQIIEEFESSPEELKGDFMFLLLKIVAAPITGRATDRSDGESMTRLSVWLQNLAFERLAEMEAICPSAALP